MRQNNLKNPPPSEATDVGVLVPESSSSPPASQKGSESTRPGADWCPGQNSSSVPRGRQGAAARRRGPAGVLVRGEIGGGPALKHRLVPLLFVSNWHLGRGYRCCGQSPGTRGRPRRVRWSGSGGTGRSHPGRRGGCADGYGITRGPCRPPERPERSLSFALPMANAGPVHWLSDRSWSYLDQPCSPTPGSPSLAGAGVQGTVTRLPAGGELPSDGPLDGQVFIFLHTNKKINAMERNGRGRLSSCSKCKGTNSPATPRPPGTGAPRMSRRSGTLPATAFSSRRPGWLPAHRWSNRNDRPEGPASRQLQSVETQKSDQVATPLASLTLGAGAAPPKPLSETRQIPEPQSVGQPPGTRS